MGWVWGHDRFKLFDKPGAKRTLPLTFFPSTRECKGR